MVEEGQPFAPLAPLTTDIIDEIRLVLDLKLFADDAAGAHP